MPMIWGRSNDEQFAKLRDEIVQIEEATAKDVVMEAVNLLERVYESPLTVCSYDYKRDWRNLRREIEMFLNGLDGEMLKRLIQIAYPETKERTWVV